MSQEQKYVDRLKTLEEKVIFLLLDGHSMWISQLQEYIPESEEKIRETLERLSETGLVRIVKEEYQLSNKFQETVKISEEWGLETDRDMILQKYTQWVEKQKRRQLKQTT